MYDGINQQTKDFTLVNATSHRDHFEAAAATTLEATIAAAAKKQPNGMHSIIVLEEEKQFVYK